MLGTRFLLWPNHAFRRLSLHDLEEVRRLRHHIKHACRAQTSRGFSLYSRFPRAQTCCVAGMLCGMLYFEPVWIWMRLMLIGVRSICRILHSGVIPGISRLSLSQGQDVEAQGRFLRQDQLGAGPERVAHEPADGQRVLQPDPERDRVPSCDPAGACADVLCMCCACAVRVL